jgi:glucokinase
VTRPPVLAVDVGGTKMAVGIVDGDGGLLRRGQVATDPALDGDGLAARLLGLVDEVLAGESVAAVGVGCGGPMEMSNVDTRVSPLNIPAWRSFPLQRVLEDHTGLSAVIDNDAKALALGEGWVGAAAGVDDYIAMVVSTGVGGGIVLDGRLLDGAGGNAGHVGHVIVEPDGRTCGCGARGCLEAEASGTAIAAITGRPAAEASDEVRERTGRLVGLGVASVANLLDLRLAVVSGSVALGYGDPFFAAAQSEIDRRACLEFSRGTVIRPGGLGAAGPLVGAAAVAYRYLDD